MADVFEVLKQDHDEVRRMLAELHIGPTALTGATDNQLAARKRLTDQLIIAGSRHEAVEEEFFWPVAANRDRKQTGLPIRPLSRSRRPGRCSSDWTG